MWELRECWELLLSFLGPEPPRRVSDTVGTRWEMMIWEEALDAGGLSPCMRLRRILRCPTIPKITPMSIRAANRAAMPIKVPTLMTPPLSFFRCGLLYEKQIRLSILLGEWIPVSQNQCMPDRWAGHRRGFPGSCCGPTDMDVNITERIKQGRQWAKPLPLFSTKLGIGPMARGVHGRNVATIRALK